jgi:hypothetical protein
MGGRIREAKIQAALVNGSILANLIIDSLP